MANVNIWFPNIARKNGRKDGVNIGHASLTLVKGTYLSWWPDGKVKPWRPLSTGSATPSYEQDMREEGGQDPVVVTISGLSEDVIASWWSRVRAEGLAPSPLLPVFHPKRPQYELFDTNCSSIVAIGLELGGATEMLGFRWQPVRGVWTPPELYAWAIAVKAVAGVKSVFGKLSVRFDVRASIQCSPQNYFLQTAVLYA